MSVKAVNIRKYGYMPFSFGCVRAVYNGGIYMKFAVFLRSDNNALKSLNPCGGEPISGNQSHGFRI